MVVEGIATVALATMVIAGLMQVAYGGVYLVFGNDAADKRKGARRLVMGGLLVLLFVLLFSLPACGPIDGGTTGTVEPATVQSLPVPTWAAYPVGQWLNMDWDLWSCPAAGSICTPGTPEWDAWIKKTRASAEGRIE